MRASCCGFEPRLRQVVVCSSNACLSLGVSMQGLNSIFKKRIMFVEKVLQLWLVLQMKGNLLLTIQ